MSVCEYVAAKTLSDDREVFEAQSSLAIKQSHLEPAVCTASIRIIMIYPANTAQSRIFGPLPHISFFKVIYYDIQNLDMIHLPQARLGKGRF
jgi:hypothetical protein